jgi:hypothetical protein
MPLYDAEEKRAGQKEGRFNAQSLDGRQQNSNKHKDA